MNVRIVASLAGLCLWLVLGCQQPSGDAQRRDAGTESAGSAATKEPAATPASPDLAAPAATQDEDQVMELALEEDADVPLLEIGSTAPQLQLDRWIQGEEISSLPSDRITVVEFWATWCPPCKDSMPHLSQLQEEYQDEVAFVGVSDESADTVSQFLDTQYDETQTWKDIVTYAIAVDQDEATSRAYLAAARATGIPTAFIVGREGIIEWIGHPMSIDQPLEKIVAGTWDREAELAQQRDLKRLQEAIPSQPADAVLALVDELMGKYPDNLELPFVRFRLQMKLERWDEARQLMEQFAASHPEKHEMIHAMAWISTTSNDSSLLEAAQRLTEGLSEQANQQDADILDTLARIHFRRGHLDEAIRLQEKALEVNGEDLRMKKALDEYKAALEVQQEEGEST